MESDLGFLKALIDDNDERVGKCLPGIDCSIVAPSQIKNFSDFSVLLKKIRYSTKCITYISK